jgi:hypothetical protein
MSAGRPVPGNWRIQSPTLAIGVGFLLAFSVPLAAGRFRIGQGVVSERMDPSRSAIAEGEYGRCVTSSRSIRCPFDRSDRDYKECWASSATGPTVTALVWSLGIAGLITLAGGMAAQLFLAFRRIYLRARSGS